MLELVVRRLLGALPLLFVVSIIVFLLMELVPGDPALTLAGEEATPEQLAAIRDRLGLDRPVHERYGTWVAGAAKGDLGTSLFSSLRVTDAILPRIPVTLSLTFGAVVVSMLLGVPAGVIAAVRPRGIVDRTVTALASIGLAVPTFWLGLILILVFSRQLGLLPPTGYVPFTEDPIGWARSMIMPSVALGTAGSAAIARQTRSALVEVLQRDYIVASLARGLSRGRVIAKHGLKNAAIPVLTILGLQLVSLLSGSVIVEQVFALPGLGALAISAVARRDVLMIQGVVVLAALIVVAVNLVVDLLYGYVNPKVRVS